MPLPDERHIPKASALIARFQSNIKSNETPLIPTSSFGSAGGKPISTPTPRGLGVHTDALRKSLDGRSTHLVPQDGSGKTIEESRPWIRRSSEIQNIAEAKSILVDTTSKTATRQEDEVALSPIILTEPSGRQSPIPDSIIFPLSEEPSPSPIPSPVSLHSPLLPVDPELPSPLEHILPAREGLSRPSSPAVDSRRLSVPPPFDQPSPPLASPPDSPISITSPLLENEDILLPSLDPVTDDDNSDPSIPSSPPLGKTKQTHSASSSKSGITEPTASFLAKAKPRISNTSISQSGIPSPTNSKTKASPRTLTSASTSTSTSSSSARPARPRSSVLTGSGSPAAKKLRPSTAPSSIPSPRSLAISPSPQAPPSSSSMSPQSSRNSNTSNTSNISAASNVVAGSSNGRVETSVPVGRKPIKSNTVSSTPTSNGTPRSRAAAAAAAAAATESDKIRTSSPGKNVVRAGGVNRNTTPNRSLPASPLVQSSSLPSTSTSSSTITSSIKNKSIVNSGGKPQRTGVGVLGYSLVSGERVGSKSTRESLVDQVGVEDENDDGEDSEDNGKWGEEEEEVGVEAKGERGKEVE